MNPLRPLMLFAVFLLPIMPAWAGSFAEEGGATGGGQPGLFSPLAITPGSESGGGVMRPSGPSLGGAASGGADTVSQSLTRPSQFDFSRSTGGDESGRARGLAPNLLCGTVQNVMRLRYSGQLGPGHLSSEESAGASNLPPCPPP
ncbi:MAG: hypothetical protein HQL66_08445 [Magnetococcales bacterium]|nr:hypothetical protein [Magnetococcales bacterium]